MADRVTFDRPSGGTGQGLLAEREEAGPDAPGVIVIHEWWGLTPRIERVAQRYAMHGYRALAVDLYDGKRTEDPEEAQALRDALDEAETTRELLGGAAQYLRALGSTKVACTGYCLGGAYALAAAINVPEVDLAVGFYGIPDLKIADPAKLSVPYQGHFANNDAWVSPERVDDLEARLQAAGADFELHRYDAQHAFCNEDDAEAFDVRWAQLAWARTQDFLLRQLSG